MIRRISPGSNELTVMVFKDNLSSRSFRIPIRWISQFGLLILLMGAIALTAVFFAVKYYRVNLRNDPTQLLKLEKKNEHLTLSLDAANAKIEDLSANPTAAVPQEGKTTAQVEAPSASLQTFPGTLKLQKTANAPITLTNLKTSWKKQTLSVQFYIHYSAGDGGNQQGRFLLIAKGSDSLKVYPERVLDPSTTNGLPYFSPKRGEYFSVSRFREVKTDFGPYAKRSNLKAIEVLIFDRQGELILLQEIGVQASGNAQ